MQKMDVNNLLCIPLCMGKSLSATVSIRSGMNGFITLVWLLIVIINLDIFILTSVLEHFLSTQRNTNVLQRLHSQAHFLCNSSCCFTACGHLRQQVRPSHPIVTKGLIDVVGIQLLQMLLFSSWRALWRAVDSCHSGALCGLPSLSDAEQNSQMQPRSRKAVCLTSGCGAGYIPPKMLLCLNHGYSLFRPKDSLCEFSPLFFSCVYWWIYHEAWLTWLLSLFSSGRFGKLGFGRACAKQYRVVVCLCPKPSTPVCGELVWWALSRTKMIRP